MAGPCAHYFTHTFETPQIGGTPIRTTVPLCNVLMDLHRAARAGHGPSRIRKLQILDEMSKKGGGSLETTQCQFGAAPPCPYYTAKS